MLVANPFEAEEVPHVDFFLPARDEAGTIVDVLARIPAVVTIRDRTIAVRSLVIDDGSTDGTGDLARRAGADVVRTPGLGLGAAVRVGLQQAVTSGAAAVVFCDADGEYDPADVADLVGPLLDGAADYVVGSRFLGGPRRMRLHRNLGNRALTALVRSLTVGQREHRLTDGQSGYRALSAGAARRAEIVHDYNYAQVLTLDLLGKGHRYHEVPITYAHRRIGRSFVSLPTYLRRVLPAVWQVHCGRPDAGTWFRPDGR
ncbi:MAG: glycosyltransferase family 2 protein [Acidimicrobiales bacterium]